MGNLFSDAANERLPETAPLALRMRPQRLEDFVGQEQVLGENSALRLAIAEDRVGSSILYGPPGSGKTTLARVIANTTGAAFEELSAVSATVAQVREVLKAGRERLGAQGQRTILFLDEIHRFNKAQQDALLPAVEEGTVTLIGATTENPYFEVNSALLSRSQIYELVPLTDEELATIVRRGATELEADVPEELVELIAHRAGGDARNALNILELATQTATVQGQALDVSHVEDASRKRPLVYDKGGEETYNILSAFHKSLRGSDPQAALFWMARMLEGGQDPMVIFRRAIAMAAEDIGLADPEALKLAVAARDAFHMLGAPEGYLPMSQMVIYLATAPKSNSSKVALDAALAAAQEHPAAQVPLHVRNAPTKLMKELGYHEGYQYAHAVPEAYIPQEYLPEALAGSAFYTPGPFGFEKEIAKRLAWWEELRARAQGEQSRATGREPSTEE